MKPRSIGWRSSAPGFDFIGAEDPEGVFVLESMSGVMDLVRRIHEDGSRSAKLCVSFEKRRV